MEPPVRTHTKRRPHFVSPTNLLLDRARRDLESQGSVRCPAGEWLDAARWAICTASRCGWERGTTQVQLVERWLETEGWTWRWEGDDLVLELPGWVQPPPRVVAIQPGLFD